MEKKNELKKVLGLPTATLLVINMIVGSGIFFKAQGVLQITKGAPGLALAAWVVAGIINLCGGLTVAELSSAIPQTGGMVAWLRVVFGDKIGYLAGWTYAFVFWPANMSAQANAFAVQLSCLFGIDSNWNNVIAVAAIVFLFVMNYFGAKTGGIITNIFTVAKLIPIIVIIVAAIFYTDGSMSNLTPFTVDGSSVGGTIAIFGSAILSTMFAYDGWQHAGSVAGEMKNPKKDLPKAITLGLLGVCAIYFIINIVYLYVIPAGTLVNSATPASDVASKLFTAGFGTKMISVGILISVFGTLNGCIMISTRIPYSMAVANELPCSSKFQKLHPKYGTSLMSFGVIFVIGIIMAVSGSFNTLADMSMFSMWIFNTLSFVAVIKYRKEHPEVERPYKVPLYPFIPGIAIVGGLVVLVSTLFTQTILAVIGLLLTGSGMIVYKIVKRKERFSIDK